MITKIKQLLNTLISEESPEFDTTSAIVCILCQVSVADDKPSREEEAAVVNTLMKLVNVDKEKATELLKMGMKEISNDHSVFDFTSQLRDLESDDRVDLIKAMWVIAYADNNLDEMEEALIRKVAALIYVSHSDFIRTKLEVSPA